MSMDNNYFQQIIDEETEQAQRLAALLIDMYRPKTVADYGCATGLYLEPFAAVGIDVIGYDNAEPALALAKLQDQVQLTDLTQDLDLKETDLSISLEVLEHIEAKDAVKVAGTIAKHSNVLVFSAAHPGQGGDGHINCRLKEYWEGVFNANGLFLDQVDTDHIANAMRNGYHMGWLPMNVMVLKKAK